MKRVWVYQADRFLTTDEQVKAVLILEAFVKDWTAHGNQLAGSAEILHGLFVVLKVDESVANVTGCSIDKSVHLLKQIENELTVNLFNRLIVAYRNSDGTIELVSNSSFQDLVNTGVVDSNTIVFNNMVTTQEEFESEWEIPFVKSWHAKVF